MEDVTFKPMIHKAKKHWAHLSESIEAVAHEAQQSAQPIWQRLYQAEASRKAAIARLTSQLEREMSKDCTFQPLVNERTAVAEGPPEVGGDNKRARTASPAYKRLYEDAAKRKAKAAASRHITSTAPAPLRDPHVDPLARSCMLLKRRANLQATIARAEQEALQLASRGSTVAAVPAIPALSKRLAEVESQLEFASLELSWTVDAADEAEGMSVVDRLKLKVSLLTALLEQRAAADARQDIAKHERRATRRESVQALPTREVMMILSRGRGRAAAPTLQEKLATAPTHKDGERRGRPWRSSTPDGLYDAMT